MKWKLLHQDSERTFALIFSTGDDVMGGITRFAEKHTLRASRFTALGAFSSVVLGYFDWAKKDYHRNPINEQVEVLSLVGDIALESARPKVHAHVVVGRRDGSTLGGHLLKAKVRPTLELAITESPVYLTRKRDAASGLALIKVD